MHQALPGGAHETLWGRGGGAGVLGCGGGGVGYSRGERCGGRLLPGGRLTLGHQGA